jgi:hypothetical protein
MSLALENRTKNGYLTNLKHGRCFAGACFPEPAGVVYNVVRAFIYYDNGKIPSSILIVALNPYFTTG